MRVLYRGGKRMSKIKVNVPFTVPIEIDAEDLQLGDDFVEVVRCKDCKWSERTDLFLLCGAWDARAVDDNDFCSSGERRSE